MSTFRPIDRETGFLLPPSVDEWLPKTHLARFVVEVIDGSPRNGRGVRSDGGSSPRHVRRSTRGRKNALRASRPTTKPSWRRGTPRPRPQARSLQGGRPSRRSRHPCPPIRSI